MSPARYNVTTVPGAGGGPTFAINDYTGPVDQIGLAAASLDAGGVADTAVALGLTPADLFGVTDGLVLNGAPQYPDVVGATDTALLVAVEAAEPRSGTPDGDPWGDAWVDYLLANQGVNHGADTVLTVSQAATVNQTNGLMKIDMRRYAGWSAGAGLSTLTFRAFWSTVAASPAGTLAVELGSSAASPWTESTVTGGNQPIFSTAPPYTQRAFGGLFDGTMRTYTITFTAAEVNDFLGRWLKLQFEVPLLTAAAVQVQPREAAVGSDKATYTLNLTR